MRVEVPSFSPEEINQVMCKQRAEHAMHSYFADVGSFDDAHVDYLVKTSLTRVK